MKLWTLIKRWWRTHKWVSTIDNYILPRRNELFYLTDWSQEKVNIFKKTHKARFYTYKFTPGPIGVGIKIECENGQEDITDYESW